MAWARHSILNWQSTVWQGNGMGTAYYFELAQHGMAGEWHGHDMVL